MAVKVVCHSLNSRGISQVDYFALYEGRLDLRQVRNRFRLLFVILYLNVKEEITFSVLRANRDHLSFMTFEDGDVLHITGVKTSVGRARDTCKCLAVAVRNPSKVCPSKDYPKGNGSRPNKGEKVETYFTPLTPVHLPPMFSSSIDTSSVEPKSLTIHPSPPKYKVPHTSPESERLLPRNQTASCSHHHDHSECSTASEEYTSPRTFPDCPPTRFNTPFTSPEFLDPYY